MNLPDRRKQDWGPWRPAAVLQEAVSHAGMLAFAWFSALGYFGTILVLAAEPVLITVLSAFLYPQRGVRKHVWDLVKMVFISLFLLVFIYATYQAAAGGGDGDAIVPLPRFDPSQLGWGLGLLAFHGGVMLGYAHRTPKPRLTWAKLALSQGAVTFLTLFFMAFVAAFIGPFAVLAVRALAPQVEAGDVLVLLLVALRLSLAVLITRMPEREMDQMADNPYLD